MVIRLRGFPPPVWGNPHADIDDAALSLRPNRRLGRRDSRCRSAKAPKELKCSALEPPAICDEAGADVPRLTLRDIGPLLFSLIVQGGAQPRLTIRILGNGVNVVQSSDYPDIDERVQRAIIAVSRASTPAPMDRCEWPPIFDVHSPDPLHRNPIIGEPSRSDRVRDDCPESAQPRARTVWVYCGDLGEAP
jgi:hypothetical protein